MSYERHNRALDKAKTLAHLLKGRGVDPSYKITKEGVIQIGKKEDLTQNEEKILLQGLKDLIPWRKGPFEIFGERIDAEWECPLKWQRVQKITGSLQGKHILDIGCNNGYYLHRIAAQNPKSVLGIDPTLPYYLQYEFLSQFYRPKNVVFEPVGIQDLERSEKKFDIIFCLGILYHHQNPFEILQKIFKMLRPGGILIAESQGIQKEGPYFLLPQKKYMGLPGFWFLPTKEAHENLIRRSGFQYVKTFSEVRTLNPEQRQTGYAPYDSLKDGLDFKKEKTIEGYPPPWRFLTRAVRARVRRS